MGAKQSVNGAYNPALAKQPRQSIEILKFDAPGNFQQYPLHDTLSIPAPVRYSLAEKRAPDTQNEASHFERNQTSTQQNTSPTDSTENQLVLTKLFHPRQTKLLAVENSIMYPKANIIYHSVVHLNHHRRMNNNQFSFFEPQQAIAKHNGKEFLTEFRERMERRYVQMFDETMGRTRLFEVVDYIPSRTVRPVKSYAQNRLLPSFFFTRRSAIINQRTEPAPPSNPVDVSKFPIDPAIDRDFDVYYRPDHSHPSSTQSKIYNNSTTSSGEVLTQPISFRHHSPTASDHSASTSQTMTSGDGSDSQAYDRTSSAYAIRTNRNRINPNVSYGTVAGYNSPGFVDPFEKKINQRDPYYRKRQGIHNYAEPVLRSRRFAPYNTADYAPIPVTHDQTSGRESNSSED